jgi:fucose 4-O-acetylase-like acetyltransferase
MRLHYLDRIRVILTILVIAHHSALTYGATGDWFLKLAPAQGAAVLVLDLFAALVRAFAMGFFFFVAGYLMPVSHDIRGSKDYARERLIRLGVPTLVFGLVIGPLTVAIAGNGYRFPQLSLEAMMTFHFVLGPMWMTLALLVFSIAYMVRRRLVAPPARRRRPIPDHGTWITAVLALGIASLVLRPLSPSGTGFLGLELDRLPFYALLFVVGLTAERFGWLDRLRRRHARPWMIAAIVAVPLLPLTWIVWDALGYPSAAGGSSFLTVLQAFWEPVVAWGVIAAALRYFRKRQDEPDRRWSYLARQSYGAFILHPLVLVSTALFLDPVPLPPTLKFLVLAVSGCVLSFAFAAGLRRVRIVRRAV